MIGVFVQHGLKFNYQKDVEACLNRGQKNKLIRSR